MQQLDILIISTHFAMTEEDQEYILLPRTTTDSCGTRRPCETDLKRKLQSMDFVDERRGKLERWKLMHLWLDVEEKEGGKGEGEKSKKA